MNFARMARASKAQEIPPLEVRLTESLRAFERGHTSLGISELANAVVTCYEHSENMSREEVRGFCRRITDAAGWPEAL